MDLSQCFLLTFYHSLKTSLKSTKPPPCPPQMKSITLVMEEGKTNDSLLLPYYTIFKMCPH